MEDIGYFSLETGVTFTHLASEADISVDDKILGVLVAIFR